MSSKTDNLVGYQYTIAESIFSDQMMEKYKTGEKFYIELFELTNEIFPEKRVNIGITKKSQSVTHVVSV
jgi:hypothetical protein